MALAGFVTAGALPAAATPGTVDYVALGDSYAAGTALRKDDGTCLQSDIGFPEVLKDQSIRINLTANVACSGATTNGVRAERSALNSNTLAAARLVTLTVGAANLGLSVVLATCTSTNPEVLAKCPGTIQAAHDKLPMLRRDLITLYAEVAKAAPSARIVVTGYPQLFEPPTNPNDPNAEIIIGINDATDALNATIRQAVSVTNAADINIHYVDVTEEFAGHGIGCTEPCTLFINNLPDPEAFHPTAEGYAAYAEAIKTKLPGGWFDKSSV